jgi:NAD-dependent deacetylase
MVGVDPDRARFLHVSCAIMSVLPTVDRVASWIRGADRIVVLTGAGIAAESGVPVFRGPGGLWRQFRVEDLATPEAFHRQPDLVWEWYLWRRGLIAAAQPNAGHLALAHLQQRREGVTLLTQNVDGLHGRAGSVDPVELHGNIWRVRCADGCGDAGDDYWAGPPRQVLRCRCGAWLRPAVVWFGELLDGSALDRAFRVTEEADVVLVVGTSGLVYPVAALPQQRRRQARLVEINVEETPLTSRADAHLRGPASEVLPSLVGAA